MRIQATDRPRPSCSASRRLPIRSTGGFGFLEELKGAGQGCLGDSGPHAASGVGGPVSLLMVQEVDIRSLGHRRARRRAEALLDRLEGLRRDILFGAVSLTTLTDLTALIDSERAAVDDPELAAILDAVDLRVRVELAKLETACEQAAKGGAARADRGSAT